MNIKDKLKLWWHEYSWPIKMFLVSRLGLFLLAYLSLILIPVVIGEGFWRAFPHNLFLDGWSRWDSGWFIDIAQNGYSNVVQNVYLNTAFFPLYPMLVKGLQYLVQNYSISGMLISNICLITANVILYIIINEKYGPDIAQKSTLLLLFNPFSFFFSAVYTESLFLLAAVLVFHFGQRKQWLPAAICSAAAGATRLVGIITVLPLLFFYFESIGFKWRNLKANILWIAISLIGPGGYVAFQAIRFGDPFLFIRSQNAPGWKEGVNLLSALDAIRLSTSWSALKTGQIPVIYLIQILAFIIGLSVLIATRRKLLPAWWIWAFVTLLISFSVWISVGRFMIVIFPLYIGTAMLFKNKLFNTILYISIMLLSLFTILFTHWYWVG
jgi:Gpi18-like mannosyltransferase